jgi:hypothetical protein
MRQAIESPSLSIQMGNRAQLNAISNFSEERMVEEHLQLYRRIAQSSAATNEGDVDI